jgi:MFS family permease
MAGIPLLFGGFGSLIAGALTSRWIGRGAGVVPVRRAFAYVGFTGAAALLMASFYIKDPLYAVLSMGLASFCNDLTIPGSWTSCMDIGGKYTGTVSGSMNMMGNFGGMAGPLVVGLILQATHRDWHLAFLASSVIYFLGAVCWIFIDPVTPLEEDGQPKQTNQGV